MTTGTAGTQAREYAQTVTHFVRKPIAYNTPNIGTAAQVKVGTLPAGARIKSTRVQVTEAFNAGTTNTLKVGTSANDDALVETGDVDLTTVEGTDVLRGGDLLLAADTDIYVEYGQSGAAASAGAADVIVEFWPDNDRQS